MAGEQGDRNWGFRTRAVHAGAVPDPSSGSRAVPIHQTSSFVFQDAQDAASLFALLAMPGLVSDQDSTVPPRPGREASR